MLKNDMPAPLPALPGKDPAQITLNPQLGLGSCYEHMDTIPWQRVMGKPGEHARVCVHVHV